MTPLKKILIIVTLLVVLGGLTVLGVYTFINLQKPPVTVVPSDIKNISYIIDGETYLLHNGLASKDTATNSVTKKTVQIFGEPVYGDLNGDGFTDDAAILLVSNQGGTGAFYYAVLAIKKDAVYTSTNALLLGDRIAPQTVEIRNGKAIFNYAERKIGEPMTTPPSVGKSLFVNYERLTNQIGELVQNFEGEANPSTMTLTMKEWSWVRTDLYSGASSTPKKANSFTLSFASDGKVHITTDCTNVTENYTLQANKKITFDASSASVLYCEGSQAETFLKTLEQVTEYTFTSKGELILTLSNKDGTITLR